MSLLSYALIVAMSFLQAGHVAVDPDPYGSVFFISLMWILIYVTCAGPDPVPGD